MKKVVIQVIAQGHSYFSADMNDIGFVKKAFLAQFLLCPHFFITTKHIHLRSRKLNFWTLFCCLQLFFMLIYLENLTE